MSADEFELFVEGNGAVSHVYDDALVGIVDGEARTARASHVEPCDGGWMADMSPVGGPVLLRPVCCAVCAENGASQEPFKTRAEALAAERAWLSSMMEQRKVSAL